jgi:hypothetical protein
MEEDILLLSYTFISAKKNNNIDNKKLKKYDKIDNELEI